MGGVVVGTEASGPKVRDGSDVVLGNDYDCVRIPHGDDLGLRRLRRPDGAPGNLLIEAAVAAHARPPERVRRVRAVRVPGLRPRAHRALEDEVPERPKQTSDDEHADRDGNERDDVVARRRPAIVVVIPTAVSRLICWSWRRLLSQGQLRSG